VTTPIATWSFGDSVKPLVALLARGGVLAIPTESSYGLGVDPRSQAGVDAVYRLKERERGKPLPVVVADLGQAEELGVDTGSEAVLRVAPFWPAPLTVVAPLRPGVRLAAAGGRAELAIRIPDHQPLRALLRALGLGLTATSANKSGQAPLLEWRQAARLLAGSDAVVVLGEPLPGGAPSTVVSFRAGRLHVLRAGRFPAAALSGCDRPAGS
jgi:L-threonylcarbamoyladenylate synthase